MRNPKKALWKTISWRVLSSIAFFALALLMLDSIKIASSLTIIDAILKTILYYFHELAWQGRMRKK